VVIKQNQAQPSLDSGKEEKFEALIFKEIRKLETKK